MSIRRGPVRRTIREKVKSSPLARAAALPMRTRQVGRANALLLKNSVRWLAHSREHSNFTYDLTEANREHLAWFVAHVAGVKVGEVRGYIAEIEGDEVLRIHIRAHTMTSSQRGLADLRARYGRRIGWYALARAVRPEHIVESGTDKGLGSCVLAAALLRNGMGKLTTLDINPAAGYLIGPPYSDVTNIVIADSVESLSRLDQPVDMFIHDSDHSPEHEAAEFRAIDTKLALTSWVISDNSHVTTELAKWAEAQGREFLFFDERPAGHWYPGGGIGLALPLPGAKAPGSGATGSFVLR